jgi:WD40-like Beta Propeller Repeat
VFSRSGVQEDLFLTRVDGSQYPVWSPDGRRIASAVIPLGWSLFDVSGAAGQAPVEPQPDIDDSHKFWPMSWASDGSRLAGLLVRANGLTDGVAQFELATRRYTRIVERAPSTWLIPVWLRDGRRLLLRDRGGISLIDSRTGSTRRLLDVSGYYVGYSLDATRDDRWITYTETATDGDIWLLKLE